MNRFEQLLEQWTVNSHEVKRQCQYTPQPTDIVIVGHVKTGTTWLQQILHQIRTKGDESFADIYQETWWIPNYYINYDFDLNGEQKARPRIYKSHELFNDVPKGEGVKYIFVAREPCDTVWSLLKFVMRYYGVPEDLSVATFKDLLKRPVVNGSGLYWGHQYYWDFLLSWWPQRANPNVLWIFYEDLQKDLRTCIRKLAAFINVPMDEAETERIHRLCTFDYMAQHKEKFKGYVVMEALCRASGLDRWQIHCGMVRPDGGQIGQGMRNLDCDLQLTLDQMWKDRIESKLGFKNYYELYEAASVLDEQREK